MSTENSNLPPEELYRQPGAMEHKKSVMTFQHIIAYLLFGLLGLSVVAGAYYYEISQKVPDTTPPVHHENANTTTDTSNWKTYSNSEYGFSFKYPSDRTLIDGKDQGISSEFNSVDVRKNLANNEYQDISFTTSKEDLAGRSKFQSQTTLDGVQWNNTEFNDGVPGEDAPHDSLAMFANKNGLNYEITIYPATDKPYDNQIKIDPLLNQIVSTFKFTDSSTSADTSTSQVYTSKEAGYSFSYSNNLMSQPIDVTGGDLSDQNLVQTSEVSVNDGEGGIWVYDVSVYNEVGNETVDQVFQNLLNFFAPLMDSEYKASDIHSSVTKVDGVAAKEMVIDNFGDHGNARIVFVKDNKVYEISGSAGDYAFGGYDIDSFASTFKFTN